MRSCFEDLAARNLMVETEISFGARFKSCSFLNLLGMKLNARDAFLTCLPRAIAGRSCRRWNHWWVVEFFSVEGDSV